MPKNMTNIDIREYEGGDFAKIEDNYTDRQVQAAIANRTEKLIEYVEQLTPSGAQSDWEEDNSTAPAFIKNKPFYSKTIESYFGQFPTTTSGTTPDPNYVWFIEQAQNYALHEVLAGFENYDTVYTTITYSVNGAEQSDTGKFTLTFEGGRANLDYDAPAGSRWYGAYISEVNLGDTTIRWPVASTDSGSTVYITNIKFEKIKQINAKYIPESSLIDMVNSLEARVSALEGN